MMVDVDDWIMWSHAMASGPPTAFYAQTHADYLPLYPTILWLLGVTYAPVKSIVTGTLGIHVSPLVFLVTFYKAPAILADVATVITIYVVGRRWATWRQALYAAAIYAVNPALIMNSARWGQVDSIGALFLLLAVVALVEDYPIACGSLLALSIMTKPTGIVLLPLAVAAYSQRIRRRRLIPALSAFAVASLTIAWPYKPASVGLAAFLVQRLTVTASRWPVATMNAFNVWAIFNHDARRAMIMRPDSTRWLGVSQHMWGFLLLAALGAGLVGVLLRRGIPQAVERRARALIPIATALTLSFFILLTRMHERHMLPALPLAALLCLVLPRYWPIYIVLSIDYVLNLHFAYPSAAYFPLPAIMTRSQEVIFVSLLNIAALIACIGLSPSMWAISRIHRWRRRRA